MAMATPTRPASARPLILVRHGATEPNLAGLRCGGDLDVPLTALGREQAEQAALHIRELGLPVGVIVASHLQRTRESAAIIGRLLGCTELVVEPAFAERSLGVWNLRSVAETERELVAGITPPGGESNAAFFDRIVQAMRRQVLPRLAQRPLLVGSKGVGRALCELLGLPPHRGLANGELVQFDLAAIDRRQRARSPAKAPAHV